MFLTIKPNLFVGNFNEKIKQNIKRVKSLPKIKGVKEILYPGQNKQKRFKKNVNKKIYISENIKNDLESLIAS
jgi:LDH2 family malate/lactate/ureidoglycolate dehydrogenase